MNSWIYIATTSQSSLETTVYLACDEGIIACPYFLNKDDVWQGKNHVAALSPGDKLSLLYVENGTVDDVLEFELAEADAPLSGMVSQLGIPTDREISPVFSIVEDQALIEYLKQNGYDGRKDPKLDKYTVINLKESAGALSFDLSHHQSVYEGLSFKQPALQKMPPQIIETGSQIQFGIGIDFSGGRNAAQKTWLARVEKSIGSNELVVTELKNGLSYEDIVDSLENQPSSVALLDFPFGLAALTCKNLGIETGLIDEVWDAVARLTSADEFQSTAKANKRGKGTERPHKRNVDVLFKTPFAPINLRMFRQTYYGIAKVLNEARQRESEIRIAPWDLVDQEQPIPFVAEGCPASFLKAIGLSSSGYKSKDSSGRQSLLSELIARFRLTLTEQQTKLIIQDSEGDALDAVILAIGAVRIQQNEIQESLDFLIKNPTEGFVYIGSN